ncbi:Putative Radical SAM domain protein [Clostridium chauvoei JF4335]|nr:Putative Radical SAM domain protein [Clostridium chauvoei JF4335]
MNHIFEDIEVKIDGTQLLEDALKKKRKKCMIGTGAMRDPYIHIEEKLQNTRKSLEIIEKLCKIIEPNVSTTKERFEVLKVMRDNGIPTVVWISPILPYINDTEKNNGIQLSFDI